MLSPPPPHHNQPRSAWLKPHFGMSNAQLKFHLGLTVPGGSGGQGHGGSGPRCASFRVMYVRFDVVSAFFWTDFSTCSAAPAICNAMQYGVGVAGRRSPHVAVVVVGGW